MDRIASLPEEGPLRFPTVNTPADYEHDVLADVVSVEQLSVDVCDVGDR